MAQAWTFNNNTLYGTFIRRNQPVPAIEVALKKKGVSKSIDVNVTDTNGDWAFDIASNGTYSVYFYGGSSTEDDYIIDIDLILDVAASFSGEALVFVNTPSLTVTEGSVRTDVNKNEFSKAILTFNNLAASAGILTFIAVDFKDSDDTEWEELDKFTVTTTDNILSFNKEIRLLEKPNNFDFRARFLNVLNIPAKEAATILLITDLAVTFNGVPDLFEYVEVPDTDINGFTGPEALNATGTKNGRLVSDEINLQWDNLKKIAKGVTTKNLFPITLRDAFGALYDISAAQSARIEGYVVYMFVSNTTAGPSVKFPGISAQYGIPAFDVVPWDYIGENNNDPNGTWVFVGEFTSPYCTVRCPSGTSVWFWIGFKTEKTITAIVAEKKVY